MSSCKGGILLLLFGLFTFVSCQNCYVDNQDGIRQKCIFPWKFKGKEYSGCTTDHDVKLWCSTKVDSNGNHAGGKYVAIFFKKSK